jgi:hypothetical protein
MTNTKAVFERLNYGRDRLEAVQKVREVIQAAADPLAKAISVINDIIGLKPTFEDPILARVTAQKVAEEAFKANHVVDNEEAFLANAREYATKFTTDPKNQWMFAKDDTSATPSEAVQFVEGIDVKVEVKANGKIKKGGKQVLAAELYKKHVLEATTAMTNQEFIACLVKELGMSKAGATTYAYNCKKAQGEPAGGLVKAKKGRKAKAK